MIFSRNAMSQRLIKVRDLSIGDTVAIIVLDFMNVNNYSNSYLYKIFTTIKI